LSDWTRAKRYRGSPADVGTCTKNGARRAHSPLFTVGCIDPRGANGKGEALFAATFRLHLAARAPGARERFGSAASFGGKNQWPGRGVSTTTGCRQRRDFHERVGTRAGRNGSVILFGARRSRGISPSPNPPILTRARPCIPVALHFHLAALPRSLIMILENVRVHRRSTGNRNVRRANVRRNLRAMCRVRVCNPD